MQHAHGSDESAPHFITSKDREIACLGFELVRKTHHHFNACHRQSRYPLPSMLHFEDLQEWNQTVEEESVALCDAFEALQERLNCSQHNDELPTSFVVAAIAAAKESAWPPQLLQQTLDALFNAIQGADVYYKSWPYAMCCPLWVQDKVWLFQVHRSRVFADACADCLSPAEDVTGSHTAQMECDRQANMTGIGEALSKKCVLCISILCHALRSQVSALILATFCLRCTRSALTRYTPSKGHTGMRTRSK